MPSKLDITSCYSDYLRLPRHSGNPAGRPSSKIPQEILQNAFDKLIDEIKDKFSSHSFQMSYLAERMAKLTELEDAVIDNRVVKSLLIDKYGEKILFSYPTDRSKSSLVFMSFIPLENVIERVRTIDSTNHIVKSAKELREELLTKELIPSGYLCDETLINKLFKNEELPPTWKIFMQALFSSKNQKLLPKSISSVL